MSDAGGRQTSNLRLQRESTGTSLSFCYPVFTYMTVLRTAPAGLLVLELAPQNVPPANSPFAVADVKTSASFNGRKKKWAGGPRRKLSLWSRQWILQSSQFSQWHSLPGGMARKIPNHTYSTLRPFLSRMPSKARYRHAPSSAYQPHCAVGSATA